MNSNIDVFNQYVLDSHQALKNSGYDIDKDDMLEHLLDTYFLAQDNEFHAIIAQLKTNIDDGTCRTTYGQGFQLLQVTQGQGHLGSAIPRSSKDRCFISRAQKLTMLHNKLKQVQ